MEFYAYEILLHTEDTIYVAVAGNAAELDKTIARFWAADPEKAMYFVEIRVVPHPDNNKVMNARPN